MRNPIATDDITASMYICTSIRRDPDSPIFPIGDSIYLRTVYDNIIYSRQSIPVYLLYQAQSIMIGTLAR